jgi:hypothetical protein
MGDNGDSRKAVVVSSEQAQVEAAAAVLMRTLQQLYPLESPQKLAQIAMHTMHEQAKLAELMQVYVNKSQTHVEFRLLKPTKIIAPEKRMSGLQLVAPLRLENCNSQEEVMKSISIFAILASPVAQAVLSVRGYKMQVGMGKPASQVKADNEKKD